MDVDINMEETIFFIREIDTRGQMLHHVENSTLVDSIVE